MFSAGNTEKIFNKCPICGGELEYIDLYQYSRVYRILKNGKVSKKMKYKREEGPMECGFIDCSNQDCDFHTDCDLDTDIKGDYKHIYIHENNKHQFMIDIEE